MLPVGKEKLIFVIYSQQDRKLAADFPQSYLLEFMNLIIIKQFPDNNFSCSRREFVICINARNVLLTDLQWLNLAASRSERTTKQEVTLIGHANGLTGSLL